MSLVLGINPAHDASVAVAVDGKIVFAVAEERLTRKKHHAHGFVAGANHALKLLGQSIHDIRRVVICRHGLQEALRDEACKSFLDSLQAQQIPLEVVESHHDLHACSAFLQSPFDEAAVLVLDGSGTHARHLPAEYRECAENPSALETGLAHESMSLWQAGPSGMALLRTRLTTGAVSLPPLLEGAAEAPSPYFYSPWCGSEPLVRSLISP